jgi:fused signal recognition particle receptor
MFGIFKKKLKEAIGIFSRKAEESAEEKVKEEKEEISAVKLGKKQPKEEKKQKKEKPKKEKKKEAKIRAQEEKEGEQKEEVFEEPEQKKEKKGFFRKLSEKITHKKISREQFEKLFWDFEVMLLENNVALEVVEKIKKDLESDLVEKPVRDVEKTILDSLKKSVAEALGQENIDIPEEIKKSEKKPYVIVFVGTNGSGKTTTIAKLARLLQKNRITSVFVAADTWRSAAIEQLDTHAKNLNIPIVKAGYGADPAAVAFDGIAMAKSRKIDVVLIDTAGRQHSNVNLVKEMEKIIRVTNPDLKIFIGESITGNDCIEQIRQFDKAVKIDGIILTKADVDEKGGTAISTSYVSRKPILYLGVGQSYDSLEPFSREKILSSLGL